MLRPGSRQRLVRLRLRKVDLDSTRVQERLIEVLPRLLCLFFILEADEAELSRPVILVHDLGVGDRASLLTEVIRQINLFQVLRNVLDYQATHS